MNATPPAVDVAQYGWSRDPFVAALPSDAIYISPALQEQLDLIQHLARFDHRMILLIGEAKSGKSTFANYLVAHPRQALTVHCLAAKLAPEPDVLLATLIKKVAPGKSLAGDAQQQLQTLLNPIETTLLLIDDAHLLSEAALKLVVGLANAAQTQQAKLRLCLLGDGRLLAALKQQNINDSAWQRLSLAALGQEETQRLLAHLAQWAGARGMPWNARQLALIYRNSQGRIGLVTQYAQQFLAPTTKASTAKARIPLAWWLGAASVLLLTLGAALALNWPPWQTAVEAQQNAQAEVAVPQPTAEAFPQQAATAHVDTQRDTESTENIALERLGRVEAPSIGLWPGKPVAAVTGAPVTGMAQILAIPPQHFTLQLLGAGQEKTRDTFIKRYGLIDNIYVYQTLRSGKPWYVVLYGDFSSREEALSGSKDLPPALQQAEPWIRPYAAIQQEVRAGLENQAPISP